MPHNAIESTDPFTHEETADLDVALDVLSLRLPNQHRQETRSAAYKLDQLACGEPDLQRGGGGDQGRGGVREGAGVRSGSMCLSGVPFDCKMDWFATAPCFTMGSTAPCFTMGSTAPCFTMGSIQKGHALLPNSET